MDSEHRKEKNIKIWTWEVPGYKLLDSGGKKKLEEIEGVKIVRAEPRAWWKKELPEEEWKNTKNELEAVLDIGIEGIKAKINFKESSKHIGIFPEQFPQWQYIKGKIAKWKEGNIKEGKELKILNLFGYTGIASLVAASAGLRHAEAGSGLAKAGVKVTHVDASKQSVDWARENQRLTEMANAPIYGEPGRTIRWIVDDAVKFLKREVKRPAFAEASAGEGRKYDAIIMDPPSYGRGPKGEVWKIEEELPKLLSACREVLSDNPLFVIFNMYSTELSSISVANLLSDMTKGLGGKIECGELAIKQENSERLLPMSIFAIWEK